MATVERRVAQQQQDESRTRMRRHTKIKPWAFQLGCISLHMPFRLRLLYLCACDRVSYLCSRSPKTQRLMSSRLMNSICYFYIFVFSCLITSSQCQAQDSCITCIFTDYAKSSLGTWFDEFFFPTTGGALQLFQLDPEPPADPESQAEPEQKNTDLPGQFDKPGADIEIQVTADPVDNEKCNPNSAGVSDCHVPDYSYCKSDRHIYSSQRSQERIVLLPQLR